MLQEAIMATERRGRGRPKSTRPRPAGVKRAVKLPEDLYDALCRIAVRRDMSVHALLVAGARRLVALEKRIPGGLINPTSSRPS